VGVASPLVRRRLIVPVTFVLTATMIMSCHPLTKTRLREMVVEITAPVLEA
jgi:hypothetical protein